jgi:uncharacterized protein
MSDLFLLSSHLNGLGRVLLGYSGGVDSALLAVVAARTLGPERFLAVLGVSASVPEEAGRRAVGLADRFSIPLLRINTHELDDPRYSANPVDRCYFCKTELWDRLGAIAAERGFDTIIDGSHADDAGDHRPGARAAAERAIRSPLAELGWRKADIRRAARELDLPVWDAPAAPCLASRIRYGLEVTSERLLQVERGEAFLRSLGITGDLRVRHHGDSARIEVEPQWFQTLDAEWSDVAREFRALGFQRVERDARGYRRGSLLVLGAGQGPASTGASA